MIADLLHHLSQLRRKRFYSNHVVLCIYVSFNKWKISFNKNKQYECMVEVVDVEE